MLVYSWLTFKAVMQIVIMRKLTHVNSKFLRKLQNLQTPWNVTTTFYVYPR